MTAALARQQFDNQPAFAMPPCSEHEGGVMPVHLTSLAISRASSLRDASNSSSPPSGRGQGEGAGNKLDCRHSHPSRPFRGEPPSPAVRERESPATNLLTHCNR